MPSPAAFNKNLHGFRGLLALSVMVGHCDIADIASTAVWFFFVLSGYLLAGLYPRGMRLEQLAPYAVRRVARLMPLYVTVLAIITLVPTALYSVMPPQNAFHFQSIAATIDEHLTFRRGNIHFWTICQEMAGYVLIAALMLARARLGLGLFIVLCIAVAAVTEFWFNISFQAVSGEGGGRNGTDVAMKFCAIHFVIGVVAASVPVPGAARRWAFRAAIAILGAIVVAGVFHTFIKQAYHVPYWHLLIPAQVWGLIGAVVIVGLANGPTVLDRFSLFGTLSYGIYIFHFLVKLFVESVPMNQVQLCFAVAAITIPLAWLSYRFIEGPCIGLAHRLTRRARPDVAMAAGN